MPYCFYQSFEPKYLYLYNEFTHDVYKLASILKSHVILAKRKHLKSNKLR